MISAAKTILIPVDKFICQVAITEHLNLYIIDIPKDFLIESYKYVAGARKPILRLKELKEKRLNHYLKDLDYYFYNKNIHDIFPDSSLITSCREIIKEDNSLICTIQGVSRARSKK